MAMPKTRFDRLDRLFRIGERLWNTRADVREVHGYLESWGFWCWLMFSGAVEDAELQSAFYPLPETYLTDRVVGPTSIQDFIRDGVVDCNRVHMCLADAGLDFGSERRVLDFGCGCGRLIRVMARYADSLELHGVDVDPDAIRFCQESFDFGRFEVLPQAPPCQFADAEFDVVYAYSVFTHLPEEAHLSWLAELARVTAKNGLVVLTTGGRRLVEHWLRGQADQIPTSEQLRRRLPELESEGFLFFPYEQLGTRFDANRDFFSSWDLQQYGMTFLTESYIRSHWVGAFELVGFYEAPDDWQDFVVLKRR